MVAYLEEEVRPTMAFGSIPVVAVQEHGTAGAWLGEGLFLACAAVGQCLVQRPMSLRQVDAAVGLRWLSLPVLGFGMRLARAIWTLRQVAARVV